MKNACESISIVWSQFPTEFKNSKLFEDVNKLKSTFEEKNDFIDNFLTKIVIIGNVSTGKSTLINALLGRDYFSATEGHGTGSFFYCGLSEKNYEYFTVNNCPTEHREIETLKNASRLNENLPYYFDENSILKVYVKPDESRLLARKTVIMDCPGLGHSAKNDEEVYKHCSNADLFIIMFGINEPATVNQSNDIKTIRENYKNPRCFFVYNKCDLSQFDEQMETNLSNEFFGLFGEEYARSLKINGNPLYFISARNPDGFEDFSRLKADIMAHRDNVYLRYVNIHTILSDEITIYRGLLDHFVSNEKDQLSSLKIINDLKNQFLNSIEKHIEKCKNNLLIENILEIIRTEIYYDQKFNIENASIKICKVEENIGNKVGDFIENHLIDQCIDPINQKFQELINDNTNGTIIFEDFNFRISRDYFIMSAYRNIKKEFSLFAFGDQTTLVKNSFIKFIQSEDSKKQINDSLINIYNNEFSVIRIRYEDFLEKSSRERINLLEIKLETLVNYQKEVYENKKRFDSFSEC